jgi:hypothetical protein
MLNVLGTVKPFKKKGPPPLFKSFNNITGVTSPSNELAVPGAVYVCVNDNLNRMVYTSQGAGIYYSTFDKNNNTWTPPSTNTQLLSVIYSDRNNLILTMSIDGTKGIVCQWLPNTSNSTDDRICEIRSIYWAPESSAPTITGSIQSPLGLFTCVISFDGTKAFAFADVSLNESYEPLMISTWNSVTNQFSPFVAATLSADFTLNAIDSQMPENIGNQGIAITPKMDGILGNPRANPNNFALRHMSFENATNSLVGTPVDVSGNRRYGVTGMAFIGSYREDPTYIVDTSFMDGDKPGYTRWDASNKRMVGPRITLNSLPSSGGFKFNQASLSNGTRFYYGDSGWIKSIQFNVS